MKNRFDLEEAIGQMAQFTTDIDTVIYAIGDAPEPATEDGLLNMLIGMKQLHETRYQKMWAIFEELIKNGTISNKNVDNAKMPPYDDGTMAMKVTDSEGSVE